MNSNTLGNGKALTLAIVAAMGLGLAAHTTHADEAAPQRVVRYVDLKINTPAGAGTLYRRIKRAANQVCELPNSQDLHVAAVTKVCEVNAIRTAVLAINNPLLNREYAAANHVAPTSISVASLP